MAPTAMLDRLVIARALREMATLLEVRGQEPFRSRAYARGVEALERLNADLGRLIDERRLTQLSGIGPGLAAMITALQDALGVETVEDLEAACEAGRARTVKGINSRSGVWLAGLSST